MLIHIGDFAHTRIYQIWLHQLRWLPLSWDDYTCQFMGCKCVYKYIYLDLQMTSYKCSFFFCSFLIFLLDPLACTSDPQDTHLFFTNYCRNQSAWHLAWDITGNGLVPLCPVLNQASFHSLENTSHMGPMNSSTTSRDSAYEVLVTPTGRA